MAVPAFILPPGLPVNPALFSTLLDLLPLGVIYYTPIVDATGTLTDLALAYLNPAAQRMTQLPAQPATTYRQQFPTTEENGAWDFHRRSWLTQQPQHFHFYYDADGFDAYFRVTAQRLGEGLLVVFTDTQDEVRSQAEQALLASQAREREHMQQLVAAQAAAERERAQLQALLTQAPVAIGLFTGDELRVSAINPRMASLLGYAPAQLLGHPLFEQAPELQGQGFDDLMRQVQATQVPFVGQEVAATVQRNGEAVGVYFNFVYQPLYDAEGRVVGILNVAVEVTEQVQARQQVEQLNQELEARVHERTRQLSEQQALLNRVFAQAPVAIFVLRGAGYVFEVVNASMGRMLDMAPDYLLGKGYFEVLPALEEQGYRQLLDHVWHAGQEYVAQEQAARLPHHPEGETGYYNFTYAPLREDDGRVAGILCVAVDVTSQVLTRQQVQILNEQLTATNEELHASNQQLTRTNVDLDTFVYTASHDLKAPITNIESITLALRETLPPAVQQNELVAHLLDLLAQTTARFQFTIGQLTDLSKLQLAHAGPAEPVNLAAVVESVRLDLAPTIIAAEVRLTVAIAPDLFASFSPANLRSAIYNLLSNAIKYHAPDRPAHVQVRAFAAAGRVTVEVQDNGLGLNEHQQQRLFGLFQRLHTHVEGTGVGLYITKRLVENGGGTIAVHSQPAVGTTFTLTFPA